MMLTLGLDTTTPTGSIALARDGDLIECRVGDSQRSHGERLPGDIVSLLRDHDTRLVAIDRYAVCSGPGSFTGLRVGLATVQALALAHERPVFAVPTLEVLAYAGFVGSFNHKGPRHVGAWMGAHRGEVFAALYELSRAASENWRTGVSCPPLVEVVSPMVGTPEAVLAEWRDPFNRLGGEVIWAAGKEDKDLLTRSLGEQISVIEDPPALAVTLVRIAALKDSNITGAAFAIRPVYVRRPDAELARERREAQPGGACDQ